jgi:disulfide bond formation protein DsbB
MAVAASAPPTADEKAIALAAAGGDAELAGYIVHGTKLFGATCAACHGKDARGLPKLGKDLVSSEFCRKLDDDGLLAFVKRGRDTSDPLNTSQTAMPPKGGNPALSDDDLLDVIAYVRSLQKQAGAQ